jgi:putative endonuclease
VYTVYVIYNQENNKIYIGQTINLENRIRLHQSKQFKNSYTARFSGSWKLIYSEEYINRKQALIREKQLKSYQGRRFIKNLIISPVAQW